MVRMLVGEKLSLFLIQTFVSVKLPLGFFELVVVCTSHWLLVLMISDDLLLVVKGRVLVLIHFLLSLAHFVLGLLKSSCIFCQPLVAHNFTH